MKQFFKKLKTAWLVMTNKVRFDQRTMSIQDIDKRLEELLSKYTTDKYRSVAIKYTTDTSGDKSMEYIFYSTFGTTSSFLNETSSYPNNLEEAFEVLEMRLKKYTSGEEKKATDNLTIEV